MFYQNYVPRTTARGVSRKQRGYYDGLRSKFIVACMQMQGMTDYNAALLYDQSSYTFIRSVVREYEGRIRKTMYRPRWR